VTALFFQRDNSFEQEYKPDMKPAATAIIVAAGKGTRFGGPVRKQYLELVGKPVLYHTLLVFCTSPNIDRIIVVGPLGETSYTTQLIHSWALKKPVDVAEGGLERHFSVMNGLERLSPDCEWVIIHDGVRPFVTHDMIHRVLVAAEKHDCAIVAVMPADTIKSCRDHFVGQTLDRKKLLSVQTPQAFRRTVLQRAYQTAMDRQQFSTDDAALVEQLGLPVAVVAGDYRNIKITAPVDLAIARAFMEEQKS
jgi:2-C-methyl-D-erythritol 4-phosphate cytidylyltransferase